MAPEGWKQDCAAVCSSSSGLEMNAHDWVFSK
jgi:hypothetical protein